MAHDEDRPWYEHHHHAGHRGLHNNLWQPYVQPPGRVT